MKLVIYLASILLMTFATTALAQDPNDRPWQSPATILILDPYQDNAIDWDKLAGDKAVKAMIHRAYFGLVPDKKYAVRAQKAKQQGLYVGLYLLGRPGDPIKQADALIAAGAETGAKLLALDIENLDPNRSMTPDNAIIFIKRIFEKTGRYPAVYTNFSTYKFISQHYKSDSIFSKTPLWIARFRNVLGMDDFKIWKDYTIWQFQSEINCKAGEACLRRVPGTASDMDVNVFRGSAEDLAKLFDPQ